jgi:hypothetical protein
MYKSAQVCPPQLLPAGRPGRFLQPGSVHHVHGLGLDIQHHWAQACDHHWVCCLCAVNHLVSDWHQQQRVNKGRLADIYPGRYVTHRAQATLGCCIVLNSMYITSCRFGSSGTYGSAVASRIVGGLLNGILGAWKCLIGECGDTLVQVGVEPGRKEGTRDVAQMRARWNRAYLMTPTALAKAAASSS